MSDDDKRLIALALRRYAADISANDVMRRYTPKDFDARYKRCLELAAQLEPQTQMKWEP